MQKGQIYYLTCKKTLLQHMEKSSIFKVQNLNGVFRTYAAPTWWEKYAFATKKHLNGGVGGASQHKYLR